MKLPVFTLLIALGAASLLAQAPEQPAAGPPSSDLGFTYSVPHNWEVLSAPETMAQKKAEASRNAVSEEEKKGLACLEPVLTARDGRSGSVLSVQALPYACFGHEMSPDDLPGFASGALEGLKQNFDVGESVSATYVLGTHRMYDQSRQGHHQGSSRGAVYR